MKIKAKASYMELDLSKTFYSLNSASTHSILLDGKEVEWNNKIPKELMEHLTEVKEKKGVNNG